MTPALAAPTVGHPMPWPALLVLLAIVAVGYTLSCWWWPFAKCGRCEGAGKHSRSDGKVWRPCKRCKGTGRRLRVGRWVYNHFATKRDSAS